MGRTLVDQLIVAFDTAMRTLFAPALAGRALPKSLEAPVDMTPEQIKTSVCLMRVNHVGEVCAQALYAGQVLTARDPQVRDLLQQAGQEEADHLAWCATRLEQLGGRVSYLNPIWYIGAFAMGVAAGVLGDQRSLSFVTETERQVEQHLADHLTRLPEIDHASRAIVEAMKQDETQHGQDALHAGGNSVPPVVSAVMKAVSKIMTTIAHRI